MGMDRINKLAVEQDQNLEAALLRRVKVAAIVIAAAALVVIAIILY